MTLIPNNMKCPNHTFPITHISPSWFLNKYAQISYEDWGQMALISYENMCQFRFLIKVKNTESKHKDFLFNINTIPVMQMLDKKMRKRGGRMGGTK
jgi:hypothetical protein